ncbi:MAG: helix-turn-helix domain-containing protein, partial [Rhodobacteraceae bacterium]|nr:helix-turn-helix domain-containing protein [Paracoccaceae bacterium]
MSKRGPVAKYVVRLDVDERLQLEDMIRTGRAAAYRLLKARILLKADVTSDGGGWNDTQIAEALETSTSTVFRTRRQLVEEGLEAALARNKQRAPSTSAIFDGAAEAKLIALACSAARQRMPWHAREGNLGAHIRRRRIRGRQIARCDDRNERPNYRGHEAPAWCHWL